MKYEFNKVLGGLSRWIGDNLYHRMNDVQEVLARVVIGRVLSNEEGIKAALVNNGIVRTFGIIDEDGMVDVDTLFNDIKREVERKGKITVNIPLVGKISLSPEDVDDMRGYICAR
jgi:hypothetical protein